MTEVFDDARWYSTQVAQELAKPAEGVIDRNSAEAVALAEREAGRRAAVLQVVRTSGALHSKDLL